MRARGLAVMVAAHDAENCVSIFLGSHAPGIIRHAGALSTVEGSLALDKL